MAKPTFVAPIVRFQDLDDASFSSAHVRAMLVAGSGFLVDSYDNFVISLIVPMVAWEYYGKSGLPSSLGDGWVKGASSWGNMVGQVSFAILGDIFGRKRVYGYELMILIVGALLCALAVWPVNGEPDNVLILLACWRFILGVGVGGDYPVSAVITSEFASSKRRGQYIAAVFAMQGFGILLGASMAVVVLAIFKDQIIADGREPLGYCWRILAGFGAIPALASVYFRLRIPETPRFTANILGDEEGGLRNAQEFLRNDALDNVVEVKNVNVSKSFREAFATHFSKWVNLKVLIGCAACWFFLDIGYYGTSLNTPVILDIIGYGTPTSKGNQKMFDDLWNRATGTAIINLCGTVPGYWFTVFLVEPWGRKPIQYMGFVMLTLLFLFMAIFLDQLKSDYKMVFFAMYACCQFFFNFGPNTTTFIIPAEVFPTAVRSTGHGISAASGKAGAILAAQAFAPLSKTSFGFQGVLYVFASCCFMGLLFSLWVPETKGFTLEELSGESFEPIQDGDAETPVMAYRSQTNPKPPSSQGGSGPTHAADGHNMYPGSAFSTKSTASGSQAARQRTVDQATSDVTSNHSSQRSGSQPRRQAPAQPQSNPDRRPRMQQQPPYPQEGGYGQDPYARQQAPYPSRPQQQPYYDARGQEQPAGRSLSGRNVQASSRPYY
ncbi:Aste57867_12399 [Aphanomyces stellatus]|uniref:Aste57867_12399 protein n=1 Tax=Aphanomyces stellatus TaxID=120398 RepID=A0A485KVF4_9STRA|nr:hypothetical protein As57867_012353 [Aphanomyces stellatus]VFT89250.1 Aste57867_12399 [Aphanomyces stellatus]